MTLDQLRVHCFASEFAGPRVVAASLDGARVPPDHLSQTSTHLVIREAAGGADRHIDLEPEGHIRWRPRSAVTGRQEPCTRPSRP